MQLQTSANHHRKNEEGDCIKPKGSKKNVTRLRRRTSDAAPGSFRFTRFLYHPPPATTHAPFPPPQEEPSRFLLVNPHDHSSPRLTSSKNTTWCEFFKCEFRKTMDKTGDSTHCYTTRQPILRIKSRRSVACRQRISFWVSKTQGTFSSFFTSN